MDLRIDIVRLRERSPICNCISWDLSQRFEEDIAGRICRWQVDRGSWILQAPEASEDGQQIHGTAVEWSTKTKIQVRISIRSNEQDDTYAEVILDDGTAVSRYQCRRTSYFFRDVVLQIDTCESVNFEPVLPEYYTAQGVLTLESVFADAGIRLSVSRGTTLVTDRIRGWTPDRLHQAMEKHFSDLSDSPQWKLWGLVAGCFHKSDVSGVMFNRAEFGSRLPERRGFAVFRQHPSFAGLRVDEAGWQKSEAARKYLHTFVHEIGHAFNLQHPWGQQRPDALSWMNTEGRYDKRNGQGSFWRGFDFQFDREELVHLRHGRRLAVIFGGDGWRC
jgi:hypothetical protein